MQLSNVPEIKESLKEFKKFLEEVIESDDQYEGEINDLLEAIDRVQDKLKTIKDQEALKKALGPFAVDFLTIFMAAQEFMTIEEDLDFDDDFSDLDYLEDDEDYEENGTEIIEFVQEDDEEPEQKNNKKVKAPSKSKPAPKKPKKK